MAGTLEIVPGQDPLAVLLGPQDDRRASIPVVHVATGVAREAFGLFFVWLTLAECLARDEVIGSDPVAAELGPPVACVAPMLDGETLLVDLAHRAFVRPGIVVIIVVSTTTSVAVAILEFPHLVEGHQGQVGVHAGFRSGGEEGLGAGLVVALEPQQREVCLGVAVFQQNCGKLPASFFLELFQARQEVSGLVGQGEVELARVTLVQAEVVDQAAAIARAHRFNLVLTVGKKRRHAEIRAGVRGG